MSRNAILRARILGLLAEADPDGLAELGCYCLGLEADGATTPRTLAVRLRGLRDDRDDLTLNAMLTRQLQVDPDAPARLAAAPLRLAAALSIVVAWATGRPAAFATDAYVAAARTAFA